MDYNLEAEAAANKSKIKKMFTSDSLILLVFVVCTWMVLALVLPQVLSIIDSNTSRAFIIVLFFVTLGVYTSSMAAVYIHLKKNKSEIYMDEIHVQKPQ